jgi:hypothetical protein
VVNVEKLAVNAVSTVIARCDHLTDYIDSNDKTPVTDGHIDFYKDKSKKKAQLGGRVFVQVKGRSTPNATKATKREIKFGVDHDDLQFFRDNGGGIYFYVPMRADGDNPEIFYSVLNPFKISRALRAKSQTSDAYSFSFKRLPSDANEIEKIVKLAHHMRDQKVLNGAVASILENAQSISIHTLEGLDSESPTTFRLDRDDVAISVTTNEGLVVPVDIDVQVFPEEYTPREVSLEVRAGEHTYDKVMFARTSSETLQITCSEGVTITLTGKHKITETNVNLKLAGALRARLKDVNFFMALANGAPLTIDGNVSEPKRKPLATRKGLDASHEVLSSVIELFEYFGLSDDVMNSLTLNEKEMGDLLILRDGLIRNKELPVNGDGSGRWDFPLGEDKIIVLVTEGSTAEQKKLMDPFDPNNRTGLVLSQTVDEKNETIDWATIYDPLDVDDFVFGLNLHLHTMLSAYKELPDKRKFDLANQTVLKMVLASDVCKVNARRNMLLAGAFELNSWLRENLPSSLTNRINEWQITKRQGTFSDDDRRELVIARRSDISGPESVLYEACLVILLGHYDELDVILDELDSDDLDKLKSWPIWALAKRDTEKDLETNRSVAN